MIGKVVTGFGRYYTVRGEHAESLNCVLRGKIKKDPRLKIFSEPVAVGDIVDYSIDADSLGVIENVRERRNGFTRKDGNKNKEDLIAANIDQLIIIQSFHEPKFNLRFVDRLLVRAVKEGISAVLCINKEDLALNEDFEYIKQYYRSLSLTSVTTCTYTKKGLDELLKICSGKTSLFAGYSGVGKSSILNMLFPGIDLRTSEVSSSTGKGRHTTTNVRLVDIDKQTAVIDTPGMREFGLMDIEPLQLSNYFADMNIYNRECRFAPCTHDHEPNCRVKDAVADGKISPERYESYLNILYSLKDYYANMY